MPNQILGIDIGPRVLKIVQIEQLAGGSKVVDWAIHHFPSEDFGEPQIEALSEFVHKNQLHGADAFVSVSGDQFVYQLVDLPVMPEKEVPSAINYKLESSLPFPLDDAVIDYYKLEKPIQSGKDSFFMAACPKNFILKIIGTVKKAGLKINNITPSLCLLNNIPQVKDKPPFLLVYISKFSSIIILVKNGQTVFCREVKVGADNITQAMVGVVVTDKDKIEINYDKAEEIKNNFGIPLNAEEYTQASGFPADKILAMMRPALEKLEAEILRTFEYYKMQTSDETEFRLAYFSGGGAKTKNLVHYFAEGLEVEANLLPIETISAKDGFDDVSAFLSRALGAAKGGQSCLSLLPYEYKHVLETTIRKVVNIWTVSAAYIFILFLIWFGSFIHQASLDSQLNIIKKELQVQGVDLEEQGGSQAKLFELLKDLGPQGRMNNLIKVMEKLNKLTPKDVYFQNIGYGNQSGEFSVGGVVGGADSSSKITGFMQSLNATGYFNSLDLLFLKESKQYSGPVFDFGIKAVIVEDAKQ